MFDDALHSITLSDDGSYTAYSKEYGEHYHSTKDGALKESLFKHVIPAFSIVQEQKELNILDICFGLGFNTLATIYYHKINKLKIKLNIYSPELDGVLVDALESFSYPEEFREIQEIITELSKNKIYQDETLFIELCIGDAREYVRQFHKKFDIVYQDAFSPKANPILWTLEYFADIKEAMKTKGILTTYSTALATRLALYENGFHIYLYKAQGCRNSTLASQRVFDGYERVDMEHKIGCNPDAQPLRDQLLRS